MRPIEGLRVKRVVAEAVILGPVVDQLLAPDMVDEMVKEMRAYDAERIAEARAQRTQVPAEVAELDKRIARLQDRLKSGDPDLTTDELVAIIENHAAKRTELLSSAPAAKQMDKVIRAMPATAERYRSQIVKGLAGNPTEAARARPTVRRLLGDRIELRPAKAGRHLVAHSGFSARR